MVHNLNRVHHVMSYQVLDVIGLCVVWSDRQAGWGSSHLRLVTTLETSPNLNVKCFVTAGARHTYPTTRPATQERTRSEPRSTFLEALTQLHVIMTWSICIWSARNTLWPALQMSAEAWNVAACSGAKAD